MFFETLRDSDIGTGALLLLFFLGFSDVLLSFSDECRTPSATSSTSGCSMVAAVEVDIFGVVAADLGASVESESSVIGEWTFFGSSATSKPDSTTNVEDETPFRVTSKNVAD